jgi:phenylpropionate dioxygenase-like ring-hydroxylating dioxygenase large terminal subunit
MIGEAEARGRPMLSREENELLTRIGPGTAMGETMRRYWIPALLVREIAEPDGPPVRVRLLGEDLVAFRDSDGRIGLIDEYCPHRRASLFFGRNEECGLRCVYHGWKFAVDGSCVDQMNEPEENQFKHKVRVTAYPTCELGGLVWAYMGPAEKIPPLPKFAWTRAPETHRHVSKVIQECNWLQGLEGGLDTSHAPILHRLLKDDARRGGIKPSNPYVRAGAPRLVVDITDYGYQYTGIRRLGDAEMHARTYHYILPFHQIRAASNEVGDWGDAGHAWVPIDDETTMVYNWIYTRKSAPLGNEDRLERAIGNGPEHVDQTTFRSKANRDNAYLIDRAVQKTETFTGIDGINVQDRAIQESMGPICDRSEEHLGPADKGIIQMRRVLREAINTVRAGGTPAGIVPSYYDLYCALQVLPRNADWRQILSPDIAPEKILQTV